MNQSEGTDATSDLMRTLRVSNTVEDTMGQAVSDMRDIEKALGRFPVSVLTFAGGSDATNREQYRPYIAQVVVQNGGTCINIDQGPRWEALASDHYIHRQRDLITDLAFPNFDPPTYGKQIGCEPQSLDVIESQNFLGVRRPDNRLYEVRGSNSSPVLKDKLHERLVELQDAWEKAGKKLWSEADFMDEMRRHMAQFSEWALKADGILFFNTRTYFKQPKTETNRKIEELLV